MNPAIQMGEPAQKKAKHEGVSSSSSVAVLNTFLKDDAISELKEDAISELVYETATKDAVSKDDPNNKVACDTVTKVAVPDTCLKEDSKSKVACETATKEAVQEDPESKVANAEDEDYSHIRLMEMQDAFLSDGSGSASGCVSSDEQAF